MVELGSPVTANETADAIGRITGQRPALVALPATEQAATLRGLGVPPPAAALFQEMTTGFIDGRIAWEPGRRHVASQTSIEETLRGLLSRPQAQS
ncbi:hypothetical protein [Nannocystis pusilla]|uniref:hypothetical protein n=1 Tax=Nannocystis pusilla TaxID=889268 RepID=UPI003DA29264